MTFFNSSQSPSYRDPASQPVQPQRRSRNFIVEFPHWSWMAIKYWQKPQPNQEETQYDQPYGNLPLYYRHWSYLDLKH